MEQKSSFIELIIAGLIVVIITEITGVNIFIAFQILPILFSIALIIFLNLKLVKQGVNKKSIFILNILIVFIYLIMNRLFGLNIISYSFICSIAVFYKSCDNSELLEDKKLFTKNLFTYYILPLIVLFIFEKIIRIMDLTYIIILFYMLIINITIVLIFSKKNEFANNEFNEKSKKIFFLFSLIFIILLIIKIIPVFNSAKGIDDIIQKLNEAIQINDLNTYFSLDLNPDIDAYDEKSYLSQEIGGLNWKYNDISRKAAWLYKRTLVGMQSTWENKTWPKKDILNSLERDTKIYIHSLEETQEMIPRTIIIYFIIYLSNIITLYIIYRNNKSGNEYSFDDTKSNI